MLDLETDNINNRNSATLNTKGGPNLGNSPEILDIQQQIEIYTKKIEHEKINLKLCNERYTNQFEVLLKLQNRKRQIKKKRSKSKIRESVAVQPKFVKESYLSNPNLLVKDVSKKYYDSEKVRF
jgi:hypothetical protein